MLLRYKPKHDHIKCVPLIPVTEEHKKLNLSRSQVQLLPGTNEVSDDEWLVMQDCLKREIKSKVITVITVTADEKKKTSNDKANNLKEADIGEALELIENCFNPDTFSKWYQEETREEVRLAVVERMKELKLELPKFKPKGKGKGTTENEESSEESKTPASPTTEADKKEADKGKGK